MSTNTRPCYLPVDVAEETEKMLGGWSRQTASVALELFARHVAGLKDWLDYAKITGEDYDLIAAVLGAAPVKELLAEGAGLHGHIVKLLVVAGRGDLASFVGAWSEWETWKAWFLHVRRREPKRKKRRPRAK